MARRSATEGRAGFYDGVGAVRDVLQNHLLQVVALLAMEPPIADDADAYRDEEVKVLRQISPLRPAHAPSAGSTSATSTSRACARARPPRRSCRPA